MKTICEFMGHSSIKVTFDIYGRLMPGGEAVAASMLESYVAEARAEARLLPQPGGFEGLVGGTEPFNADRFSWPKVTRTQ